MAVRAKGVLPRFLHLSSPGTTNSPGSRKCSEGRSEAKLNPEQRNLELAGHVARSQGGSLLRGIQRSDPGVCKVVPGLSISRSKKSQIHCAVFMTPAVCQALIECDGEDPASLGLSSVLWAGVRGHTEGPKAGPCCCTEWAQGLHTGAPAHPSGAGPSEMASQRRVPSSAWRSELVRGSGVRGYLQEHRAITPCARDH